MWSDLRTHTLNQDPLPLPKTDSQELVKRIIKQSSWPQSIYSLMREMDKWIQCAGKRPTIACIITKGAHSWLPLYKGTRWRTNRMTERRWWEFNFKI